MATRNLKHYSKALVDLGNQYGIFDELLADLADVSEKIDANPDLRKYLLDPQIKLDKKKKALQAIFQDFISEKTYNFLFILIKDKKIGYLDQIVEKTKKRKKEEEKILEAVIESVVPLDIAQEKDVKQALADKSDKQILIKNLINPDLIAGLRITLGDIVIDSSVQGKIGRLKNIIAQLS